VLDDRTGQQLRLRDLLPADGLLAVGCHDGLHPVDEINVIWQAGAFRLIPADVDVRPGVARPVRRSHLQEGIGAVLEDAQRTSGAGCGGVGLRRHPSQVSSG